MSDLEINETNKTSDTCLEANKSAIGASMATTEDDLTIIGHKTIPIVGNEEKTAIDERVETKTTKRVANNVFQTDRSYVQILNEMFPNQTSYVEEGRTGPQHRPLFRIGVHVCGLTFHGVSRTKQTARHEAAKAAINYFKGMPQQQQQQQQQHHWPYEMRHHFQQSPHSLYNRFDNYHRYQPYYPINRNDDYMYQNFNSTHPLLSNDYQSYDEYNNWQNQWPYGEPHHQNNDSNCLLYDRERPIFDRQSNPNILTHIGSDVQRKYVGLSKPVGTGNVDVVVSADTQTNKRQKTNDFTTDDYNDDSFVEFNHNENNSAEEITEEPNQQIFNPKKERIILRLMSETAVNQNPVSVINELQPNAKWVCTQLTTNKHSTTFEMRLLLPLANQCFIGTATTKKLAKSEAASKALLQLYNISLNAINKDNPDVFHTRTTVQIAQEPLVLKQDIADRVGAAVIAKSIEVWDQLNELKKWTVLSAIVLTDETNVDFVEVICLTTGTKCVKGDSLSMNGYALNDCHAEVLCRRAFLHYLYRQIERLVDNNFEDKPDLILERRTDGYGFRLKSNIKINLFISTAPCGDSRVFSPKEEIESDNHPNRQTRGLLRAKIEGGEGTIPVKRDSIQTWDGILQGHQRLQFMSCSDKIAVWNVVGLQGALLSHLIQPIYLSSVVLASLFNYDHLVRAIHGRLNLNFDSNSLKGLPEMYALNECKVAKCQLKQDITRQLTKAPNYGINWIKGDSIAEVVSTETGRIHIENTISRLSKRSLFARFSSLLGRNTPVLPNCSLAQNIPIIYRDGKTGSLDYQRAKTQCMLCFQEQNLGNWIQVPAEIDLFRL